MKREIVIEGLDCEHCIKRVENALSELKGVGQVTVILEEKKALVELVEAVPDSELREAIEKDEAGYDVVSIRAI